MSLFKYLFSKSTYIKELEKEVKFVSHWDFDNVEYATLVQHRDGLAIMQWRGVSTLGLCYKPYTKENIDIPLSLMDRFRLWSLYDKLVYNLFEERYISSEVKKQLQTDKPTFPENEIIREWEIKK